MSRIVRSHEPVQPMLPLGYGSVEWSTLPAPVRERVLALWLQLLSEQLTHAEASSARVTPALGPGEAASREGA